MDCRNFLESIEKGCLNCFLLFEDFSFLDYKDEEGNTPLHISSSLGHEEITLYLLKKGVDIKIKNKFGDNSLQHFLTINEYRPLTNGQRNCLKMLLKYYKNDIDDKGNNLLHLITRSNITKYGFSIRLLKFVLKKYRMDINLKNKEKHTPLHNAAKYSSFKTCRCLLGYGANPNAKDGYGYTPFFYTLKKGNIQDIELFMKFKADINIRANDGDSIIHTALRYNLGRNKEYIKKLLDCGADIMLVGKDGDLVYDLCEDEEIKEYILSLMYDIKEPDL